MQNHIIYEFDKIVLIEPPCSGKNTKQACYGTLPRAAYRPGALQSLLEDRISENRLTLHASGNERIIKEALWLLKACRFFDKIIIDDEWTDEYQCV